MAAISSFTKPRRMKPASIPILLAPLLCLTLLSLYTYRPFAPPSSVDPSSPSPVTHFPAVSAANLRHYAAAQGGNAPVTEPEPEPEPEQDQPEQDRPEQDRPEQDRPEQDRPEQDRPEQDQPEQDQPGKDDLGDSKPEAETEGQRQEEHPLLTLVLTTHDVLPVLNETLETLELSNRVVLLTVDDASTDGTLDTLRNLPKNTILPLSANTLGGVGTPSNLAMETVTTKYVAFLDGDDLLTVSTLNNMLNLAEKTSAEVVYADFTRFRDTPNGRELLPSYDGERWPGEHVLHRSQNQSVGFGVHQAFGMSPVPWRKLYNVQFLRKHSIRFPEGDFVFEDNSFHWLVTTYATRIVYLNESVIAHRIGREGQSTTALRGGDEDFGEEDESVIKAQKAGAGMAHYVANQNYIGFRLLECNNGMWRCNSARLKFLEWVTGSNWIANIVDRAGDDKIAAKFRSVKTRAGEYWRRNMAKRFPGIPKGAWQSRKLRVKKAPELSIVVPVFNDMDFIDDFLANISNLNVSHEIIFVDNNSTDGSLSHLEWVTEPSDHMFLLHTAKSGAGRARNLGLLFAEADHVIFLDCDDRFDTAAIDEVVHHAQKSLSEVIITKYGLEYILKDEPNLTLRKRTGMFNSDAKLFYAGLDSDSPEKRRKIAGGITNYPWNKLVRRELLIRENIFFGSTLVNNDVLFHWHTLLKARSIEFYDTVMTYHRKFEDGDRVTDMKGVERLELPDALAMTNRVLVRAGLIEGFSESWKEFVDKLLNWGRGRVGERWKKEFDRRAKAVREVVGRGGIELVMRE